MRRIAWTILAVTVAGTTLAHADLTNQFLDFQIVNEIGVSGLTSNYSADTFAGAAVNGATTGALLPALGPSRVSYPSGIGQVPSPGGAIGAQYDQGVLGLHRIGNLLVFQLATAIDPQAGRYHSGWDTWYGQGDLFVDVQDSAGVSHYALLSAWARDDGGDTIDINRGRFSAAEDFHTGGDGGANREGHLVSLGDDSDVMMSGGRGAYGSDSAPAGLDLRTYAKGGTDLGNAYLFQLSLNDGGRNWYIQTWTVMLNKLSTDASYDVALHAAASCGNDQIGGSFTVPEPGSMLLLLSGVGFVVRFRRYA